MDSERYLDLYNHIRENYNTSYCQKSLHTRNCIEIQIVDEDFISFARYLHTEPMFADAMLISISCVDYPAREKRFELLYNFLSLKSNLRIIAKLMVAEDETIQTLSHVFPNSIWYEREIWDMYGVLFEGNCDMRRILTDYGFIGHPMRKDFPLTGHVEVQYDGKNVVYSPNKLEQDFRLLDNNSNWNKLHGDEKATFNNSNN